MAKSKNVIEEQTENQENDFLNSPELPTEQERAEMENRIEKTDMVAHEFDNTTVDGLFAEMEAKTTGNLQELTANYLSFNDWKVGEERNYIFTAMTTFNKPETGEVMAACILMNKQRENFIVASKVIVGNLMKIDKIPCPIRIKSNGKVKGANGSYYSLQVFTF